MSGSIPSGLPANVSNDLQAWINANTMMKEKQALLKKLVALMEASKDPMLMAQEVMNAAMGVNAAQVSSLSAIENVSSDLRSDISSTQSEMNSASNGTATPAQMQKIIDQVNQIEKFIKYEQGLPEDKQVFNSAMLTNLQSAVNQIKDSFTENLAVPTTGWPSGTTPPTSATYNNWGNASSMAGDMNNWYNNAASTGKLSPQLQSLQNGFQTLNQTVSALSTATNTQLQFQGQEYQQMMGIDKDAQQTILKLDSTIISNSRAS